MSMSISIWQSLGKIDCQIDEYIDLAIDFAERLSPHIAIERFVSQSPAELLIAPNWGIKNYEFTARLLKRMKERDTWQGKLFTEV